MYGLNLVQRWQYRHIPGPPPKWLLGNAAEVQDKMMHGSYEQWAKEYGPVCRIFMGMLPIVIITGPCLGPHCQQQPCSLHLFLQAVLQRIPTEGAAAEMKSIILLKTVLHPVEHAPSCSQVRQ